MGTRLEYFDNDRYRPLIDKNQISITKIASNGQVEWTNIVSDEANSEIMSFDSLKLDDEGNIYITGVSGSSWGEPVNPFLSENLKRQQGNFFIAKYNKDGLLIWNTFLGQADIYSSIVIELDEDKNISAAWNFENGDNTANNHLAKLSNSGELQWLKTIGSPLENVNEKNYRLLPYSIKLDKNNNIYILSPGFTSWGNPIIGPSGNSDGSIAKFNNNGDLIWNTFLGGTGEDWFSTVKIDENGNIFVVGRSDATWGNPLSPYTGLSDGVLVKLDSDGNLLWNTFIGSDSGDDSITDFVINSNGTFFLVGNSPATWGNPLHAFTENSDGFIAQMDSSGSLLWNTFIGGNGDDGVRSLEIDNNSNLYVVGQSDTGFGNPINDPPGGDIDGFVNKFSLVEESISNYRDAGPLTPEITTYIPTPLDLSTDPTVIGTNILLAVLLMLPFAVAVDYFSKIISDNEENLKRWFPPISWIGSLQSKSKDFIAKRTKQNQRLLDALSLLGVAIFYGIVFSLLDETWNPLTAQGLVLLGSMTLAYGIIGILDDILQWRAIRKWGIPGEYDVRPTNVFLSVVSVGISRILALLPGLMFGSPEAVKVDENLLSKSQNQSLIRISTRTYLGIAFGAWLPTIGTTLLQQSQLPDATKNYIGGLEAFLLVIFAVALENMFIQLLGFSEGLGAKLKRSNRWTWGISLVLCTAFFLHTLLNPHYDLVESLKQGNTAEFIEVALIFILITIIIRLIAWRIEGKKAMA